MNGGRTIMDLSCPTCGSGIALDDVNVARDVALCRSCERTFSFADAVAGPVPSDLSAEPPPGVSYESTPEGFRVEASTRTPWALFIIPFALAWSGGSVGSFVVRQARQGQVAPFEFLFILPFVVGSIFILGYALMTVFGRLVVTVEGDDGTIFTGVGDLGWTRRFSWGTVRDAVEVVAHPYQWGSYGRMIRLTGPRPISFGSILNEARKFYMVAVLKHELTHRRKPSTPPGEW